jgi:hypothetical protein
VLYQLRNFIHKIDWQAVVILILVLRQALLRLPYMRYYHLAFLIILCSCKAGRKSAEADFLAITPDTTQLGRERFNWHMSRVKALNLPAIHKGVDSFELRFWHGISIANPKSVTILKYVESNWHLSITNYFVGYFEGQTMNYIKLDSAITRLFPVPINMTRFLDSLNSFDLKRFPDQFTLKEYDESVADGSVYAIELSTHSFYKAIWYNNPDQYDGLFHKKAATLIDFLANNLGGSW